MFAKRIYETTEVFRNVNSSAWQAQLRRAAVSVVSNIAEGEARWSFRDQCRFYDIACGPLIETERQLILAADLGLIEARTANSILQATAEIGREINALIRSTRTRRSGI